MASTTGIVAPRPPFLQRITPRSWISIDVGLSLLFFAGGLGALFVLQHGKQHPTNPGLLVVALCLATFPLPLRRNYPFPVLFAVTAGLAMAIVLGQGFA